MNLVKNNLDVIGTVGFVGALAWAYILIGV